MLPNHDLGDVGHGQVLDCFVHHQHQQNIKKLIKKQVMGAAKHQHLTRKDNEVQLPREKQKNVLTKSLKTTRSRGS